MNQHFLINFLLSIVLTIGVNAMTSAQAQPIQFERLGLEQGLSQTDVHYILQDHKGYMWFATTDGLSKFDGYSFTTYKYDSTDSTSLSQNTCLILWEDKKGMIWIGLVGDGLCQFDPGTETFTRHPPNRTDPSALQDGVVVAMNEDTDGYLWLGTGRFNELRRMNKQTGRMYQTGYSPPGPKNNHYINTIYQDKTGTYWIGSDTGLHQAQFFPATRKQSSHIKFTYNVFAQTYPDLFRNVDVNCVFEDHAGVLWFGVSPKGLISYDRKTSVIHAYRHDPFNPNSITNSYIRRSSIAEDRQGNLWVGTDEGGLNRLNRARTRFTRYVHHVDNSASLSSNAIQMLTIDRTNILWIGTVGGGISKMDPHKRTFPLYTYIPQEATSLPPFGVRVLYEDRTGVVWVGTEGGGLAKFDKVTGQFTHFNHKSGNPKSIANNYVQALLEDHSGNFWIGNKNVFTKLNRQTQTFETYSIRQNRFIGFFNDYVFTLFEDHKGLIWLGTTNGLKSFDPRTKAMAFYPCDLNNPAGLSDYWVYTIAEDRYQNLWVGTYNGLNYWNRKTGKFKHYLHRDGHSGSLSSNTIRSLFIDANGTLWVGTLGGGVCRFNEKSQSFQTFTEKEGLANNSVYAIQEDKTGNFWFATNKGLAQFSPLTRSFHNYDVSDGLQSNQFASGYLNAGASFKGKDGLLYFGGINGFNVVDPSQIQRNRQVPAIVITKFKRFDTLVPGKHEGERIELPYDENFVSFEYAALNYTNTPKNQYAYQLVGLEDDWVYSGTRRVASYTNLNPGTYTFRVKGSNNDGVWNDVGTSIQLVIHPPWWQTIWFRLLVAIVLILTAGIAVRSYTQGKLRRQRTDLKRVLQAQEEERQRLAADLHDDLGATLSAIKGQLETVIQPNEALARPINLMEKAIRDLRHISHNLMPPEFAKLGLTEAIRETVRRAEAGSDLQFLFITHGQERRLMNETELTIYRIAIELINNAIKHAKAQQVTIQLIFYPQYVSLLVEDDGQGYPLQEPATQAGIGLRNIRSRVTYLKSTLLIDSGERGTTVTLEVPL